MNYNRILERYKYESDENIKLRISESDRDNYQENRDIINAIVLWKLNRSVNISDETLSFLNDIDDLESPLDALDNKKVSTLIYNLLASKGIRLPMASTILHFYYPKIFPIIDQRAYRELMNEEFPNYLSKDKLKRYTDLYLDYIKKSYEFNVTLCPGIPFENIDKILYQIDKEKGNRVRY